MQILSDEELKKAILKQKYFTIKEIRGGGHIFVIGPLRDKNIPSSTKRDRKVHDSNPEFQVTKIKESKLEKGDILTTHLKKGTVELLYQGIVFGHLLQSGTGQNPPFVEGTKVIFSRYSQSGKSFYICKKNSKSQPETKKIDKPEPVAPPPLSARIKSLTSLDLYKGYNIWAKIIGIDPINEDPAYANEILEKPEKKSPTVVKSKARSESIIPF